MLRCMNCNAVINDATAEDGTRVYITINETSHDASVYVVVKCPECEQKLMDGRIRKELRSVK